MIERDKSIFEIEPPEAEFKGTPQDLKDALDNCSSFEVIEDGRIMYKWRPPTILIF